MYIKHFIFNPRILIKSWLNLMVIFLLSACTGLDVMERDFGKSVRMMEQAQIYDMNAAQNPPTEGPEGISGNKSLADLYNLERPVRAEEQMLNFIKAKQYDTGK